MTASRGDTWTEEDGAEWLDGDWGPVRAGLRIVFWVWLATSMILSIHLLRSSGVERLGGAAVGVSVGWLAHPSVGVLLAHSHALAAAMTGFGLARTALMPTQAGGRFLAAGASVAFLAAVPLEVVALGGRASAAARTSAQVGATLAAVVGGALLLVALGRAARWLETRARTPLVIAIGALLGARALAAVLPIPRGPAGMDMDAVLALLSYLAFLPLIGGLARTMAITPGRAPVDEGVPSVDPRDGSVEWSGACAGLAAFSSTLRARIVLAVVAAGLGVLSMAPMFEPVRPALMGVLRLAAGAVGVAMVMAIGRYSQLPAVTQARRGAWVAISLVGIGAVTDGALALLSFEQVAFATRPPALGRALMVVADALPLLGLIALSVSYWALAVALGAGSVATRVWAGVKWLVVAAVAVVAARTAQGNAQVALVAGVVLLYAVALGRLLGATRALLGRTSRRRVG
jgi:hypothetical protein